VSANPLHYPKPAYVALATLTKVLDGVKLLRPMDRIFQRVCPGIRARGPARLFALDPRGQCEMEIEFPEETALTHIKFYGREHPLKSKKFPITAGYRRHLYREPDARDAHHRRPAHLSREPPARQSANHQPHGRRNPSGDSPRRTAARRAGAPPGPICDAQG